MSVFENTVSVSGDKRKHVFIIIIIVIIIIVIIIILTIIATIINKKLKRY